MTQEETYIKLVGAGGHTKVAEVANIWDLKSSSRELLFAIVVNAYWRGASQGIDDCRKLLHSKGLVPNGGKSTD